MSLVTGLTSQINATLKTSQMEHASRLQSPCQIFRTGRVVMLDNFETLLGGRWSPLFGNIANSILQSFSGAASLAVTVPPGLPGDAGVAIREVTGNTFQKLGFEAKINANLAPNAFISLLFFTDIGQRGELTFVSGIAHDVPSMGVFYISAEDSLTGLDTYTQIDTMSCNFQNNAVWLPVKVIVDNTTGLYMSATMGSKTYDLSTIPQAQPIYPQQSGLITRLGIQLIVVTNDGTQQTAYFDDVVITVDEMDPPSDSVMVAGGTATRTVRVR